MGETGLASDDLEKTPEAFPSLVVSKGGEHLKS